MGVTILGHHFVRTSLKHNEKEKQENKLEEVNLHHGYCTVSTFFIVSTQFVFLTYILGLAWLGIFGFSAVPVFLFYNMWTTCAAMKSPIANITSVDNICVDVRQYGEAVPNVILHFLWE